MPQGLELAQLQMNAGSQPTETTDAQILALVARGDLDAFAMFYDRFATVLYSLALRILRDTHDAEEVLQEAMTLIWERAASYDASAGKPLSWAFAITRNKAIDRIRSTQRKTRLIHDAALEQEIAHGSSTHVRAESRVLDGETSTLVRGALLALPREQREAIELAFFDGLSHVEIAATLKEPLGTVKARIRRGMLKLRDALQEYV